MTRWMMHLQQINQTIEVAFNDSWALIGQTPWPTEQGVCAKKVGMMT